MELNRALGEALRHVRKFRGMTQEDFEPTSGRPYISKIERGLHSPSVEKVAELCGQLGVTPTTLFTLAFLIADGCTDPTELLSTLKRELKAMGVPEVR